MIPSSNKNVANTELSATTNIPAHLVQLETEVHAGLEEGTRGFLRAAKAIKQIHNSKLYLKRSATFEEYCRDYVGKSKSLVYRQLKSLAVAESLGLAASTIVDINESHLRELENVPVDQAKEIVATLVRDEVPITAKAIRQMKHKEPKAFHVQLPDKEEELIKRVRSRLDDPEFVEALSRLLDEA